MLRAGLDNRRTAVHSRQRQEIFLFSAESTLSLRPTQSSVQWAFFFFFFFFVRGFVDGESKPLPPSLDLKNA